MLAFKPKTIAQWRAYALACTLTDTGVRIEEALGVKREDFDFENLLLKVRGKGRKERIVPISFELRRVLFRWEKLTESRRWQSEWVFATRPGTRLGQRNALRAHYALLKRLAIPKVEVPREGIPRVSIALTMVAVPLRPTCIIMAITPLLVSGLPIVPRTAAERPRIVVIPGARSEVQLPPVVIAIAVVPGAAASATRGAPVPFLVARVVIARVEIHAVLPFRYGCKAAPGRSASPVRRRASRLGGRVDSESRPRGGCRRRGCVG